MSLAKEYGQVYGLVMDRFDRSVALLGEEVMGQREYAEILDAGFAEIKVGLIPAVVDRIVVGDITRTRLSNIKVLFFAGVNDGIVPSVSGRGGILSEADRRALREMQVELAPTAREESFLQRFYLYLALTKPSDYLYLSCAASSAEGKAMRPSSLMLQLLKLFPEKCLEQPEEEKEAEKKEAPALLSFIRKPEMLLIQLGIVGLFALVVESAMFDWSGLYFESVLQVPKSLQIGFLVFMVMMTVGRFLTNSAYSVLGKQKVLQLAGFFIFAGFFISAMLGGMFESMTVKVIVNSLGFMLVGLGISCMVPTIYSLVGAKSKTPVGIALTILSSISFIGSLIAPLLIGAISQAFNMKYAYIVVGLLGLCILLMTTFCKAFKNN